MTKSQWDIIFKKLSADLGDRRGLKNEWLKIAPETKRGISKAWREIVEEGMIYRNHKSQ